VPYKTGQHKGVAYKIDPCDTTHFPQGYADLCHSKYIFVSIPTK